MLPYVTTPPCLARVQGKGLERWRPPGEPNYQCARELWMPPGLVVQIQTGAWLGLPLDRKSKRRRNETIAMLASFLSGDIMTVGRGNDRVDIKALNPSAPRGPWRAWELRATVSDPHTRLFGVFVGPQDFVAMSIALKGSLTGNSQTNAGQTSANRAVPLIGQNILSFSSPPTAASLGGATNGFDEPDF